MYLNMSVSQNKLKVLIADDSEEVRYRLKKLLASQECAAVSYEADSAHRAIEIAGREPIDVAVLDIQMPGSGIHALRHIKAVYPAIRVVMLTNHSDNFFRNSCIKAGADYFLDKSLEFEQLPAVLCDIAGNHGQA